MAQETKAANEYAKKGFEELREEGEAQDAELEQLREAAKHNKSVNSLRKQLQEAQTALQNLRLKATAEEEAARSYSINLTSMSKFRRFFY